MFSPVASAVGYDGALSTDGHSHFVSALKQTDCVILTCKNKRYVDVDDVPTILRTFIEQTNSKTKFTKAWCKGENAKKLLQWWIETILPHHGNNQINFTLSVEEHTAAIEDTINKILERLEQRTVLA